MGIINVLSKSTAQKIAAGEVVTRPASVVKELVENAIDAGADFITVEFKASGTLFIRVTDNGSGMEKEDLLLCVKRHATSKISSEKDLESISTLGFRGEALAAISSVSHMDIMTKTKNGEGFFATADDGVILSSSPSGCPDGTTIIVRDLFYNTPARMKFLKKDASEAAAISAVVDQAALCNPSVSFRLIRDGKEIRFTPGDNQLKNVIYEVYGKDFYNNLKEVEYSYQGLLVKGAVASPAFTRGSRSFQAFFVNGRPVRSKLFVAALEEGFKNKTMTGRYPAGVLFLSLPFGDVDVNVHPEKTEVKFKSEKEVYEAIYYAVKSALMESEKPFHTAFDYPVFEQKTVQKQNTSAPEKPPEKENSEKQQMLFREPETFFEQSRTYEEKIPPEAILLSSLFRKTISEGEKEIPKDLGSSLDIQEKSTEEDSLYSFKKEAPEEQKENPLEDFDLKFCGEIFDTYILVQKGDTAFFIDKHALHERIIYERMKKNKTLEYSQELLVPEVVNLSAQEAEILLENAELLGELGFHLESFGENSIIIRTAPMSIEAKGIGALLSELAFQLLLGKKEIRPAVRERMLYTIACKAAIKAGEKTTNEELIKLVSELFSFGDITHCPHGRPVAVSMTKTSLEKRFGRIR